MEEQGIETIFQVPACLLGAEQNHREAWSAAVTGEFNPGGVMKAASMALPGHGIFQLPHIPSSGAVPAWSLADKVSASFKTLSSHKVGFFFPALVYQK